MRGIRYRHRGSAPLENGVVDWTHYRRVVVYLAPDSFELLREVAEKRDVGNSTVAREWLEDRIADETRLATP